MIQFPLFAPDALLPWCLVRTGAHRERDVQADLYLAGWHTYLPMKTDWHGPTGRKRRVHRSLFEGYLFAACSEDGDQAAPASTKGIVAVRRRGDGKPVVRPRIMLRLMFAECAGAFDYTREKVKPPKHGLKVGDSVKVTGGVMTGFEARIVEVLSKREVVAALELFGHPMQATFEAAHLEAA